MGLKGFGERLAKVRQARGLTQADAGKGLGTNGADAGKSVVYGWEKDQHFPRVDQLIQLCDKLGCSADYLLWGTEAAWPFSISKRRFDALPDRAKGRVDVRLEQAIEECERGDESPQHVDLDQAEKELQEKLARTSTAKRGGLGKKRA